MHAWEYNKTSAIMFLNIRLQVAEAVLPFDLVSKQWLHVAVTHTSGTALSSALVRLYINGELQSTVCSNLERHTQSRT